ncbi:MAG: hypothetical protein IJX55_00705 [Clostridia bacterium]|nr:hypothetical protein [Clostridia bacterium]
MTVKLNRWGYLFSGNSKVRCFLWVILYAYCIYSIFTDSDTEAIVLIPLTIMFFVVELYNFLIFPVSSFRVGNGFIEYYENVEMTRVSRNSSYEKVGFIIKDVKYIEIKQGIIEKIFGFAHLEVSGLATAASSFDVYSIQHIPQRKHHIFYGVRNYDELYDELLKFFSSDIVKDNTIWSKNGGINDT